MNLSVPSDGECKLSVPQIDRVSIDATALGNEDATTGGRGSVDFEVDLKGLVSDRVAGFGCRPGLGLAEVVW